MNANLEAWIQCPELPTGRRLIIMRGMLEQLETREFKLLEDLIGDAIDHDLRTLELEREWADIPNRAEFMSDHPPLREVDEQLDRALDVFYETLQGILRSDDRNDPRHDDAYILLDVIFPAGSCSITSLPYIDQMGAVDALLEELGGSFQAHVKALKLEALVEGVAALSERYRDELANLMPEELVLEQLLNAREEGQGFLLQIIAMVLGCYHRNSREEDSIRESFLGALSDHVDAFEEAARGGHRCRDLDPETGELV